MQPRASRGGYVTAAVLVAATVGVLIWVLAARSPGGSPSTKQLEALKRAAAAAHCSLATFPTEGRVHTTEKVRYKTNPPTSGPHNPVPAPDRVYGVAPAPEFYVHSLEHGRIELQFRPDAPPAVRNALRRVYGELPRHMLLFPNNTGMDFEVAATAWKHRLGCARFNPKVPEALRRFRDAYRDRGPEQVP